VGLLGTIFAYAVRQGLQSDNRGLEVGDQCDTDDADLRMATRRMPGLGWSEVNLPRRTARLTGTRAACALIDAPPKSPCTRLNLTNHRPEVAP